MSYVKGAATAEVFSSLLEGVPNSNLMAKAVELKGLTSSVKAQQGREKELYNRIGVSNIQELNNLIRSFDVQYNYGALLPTGSEVALAGDVENLLSTAGGNFPSAPQQFQGQGYNLFKRGHNKFTETEQLNITKFLNEAFQKILITMDKDPDFKKVLKSKAYTTFSRAFLAYMSKVTINLGEGVACQITATTRGSTAAARKSTEKFMNEGWKGNFYSKIVNEETVKIAEVKQYNLSSLYESILGSGRIKSPHGALVMVRGGAKNSGKITGVSIQLNYDELPDSLYNQLYALAQDRGLLDPSIAKNAKNLLGNGKNRGIISPMDVPAPIWREDVFNAVLIVLSHKIDKESGDLIYNGTLNQEVRDVFADYNVAGEIALSRSISGLRGFLGELRGILIVNKLFSYNPDDPDSKKIGSLMGTQKVKLINSFKNGKGEDSPVDIILDFLKKLGFAMGIQIKNISEAEGAIYSWKTHNDKGMSIPTFYAGRLQEAMSPQELSFFAHWAYNKPVGSSYNTNYFGLWGGFLEEFNNTFIPVYKRMALYIIRQSAEIEQIKIGDEDVNLLVNDFFMMNKDLIPASAFLTALESNSDAIKAEMNGLIGGRPYGYYSSSTPLPEIDKYRNYASEIKIKYNIVVNYARLLASAYNFSST